MIDGDGKLWCDRCGRLISSDGLGGYLVRIEVFADPEVGDLKLPDSPEKLNDEINQLIAEMKEKSETALMDQVYRRFVFRLCDPCRKQYLEDPLPIEKNN